MNYSDLRWHIIKQDVFFISRVQIPLFYVKIFKFFPKFDEIKQINVCIYETSREKSEPAEA